MNYLVFGLGNPGEKYKNTRHNAGVLVLEAAGIDFIAPSTFMNESGEAVVYRTKNPEEIIIVYDDIDLPLGKIKISHDRGSGGHNGIKSIEAHLESREFTRVRIGISKMIETTEQGSVILEKPNVLGNFEAEELEIIKKLGPKVKEIIETIVKEGREKAMNKFNA